MGRKKAQKKKRSRKSKTIPSPNTVVAEFQITSPKGTRFRVRRTTQTDPYDSDNPVEPPRSKPGDSTTP